MHELSLILKVSLSLSLPLSLSRARALSLSLRFSLARLLYIPMAITRATAARQAER